MEYESKVLDLMDVESSFLVLAHDKGVVTRAKTWFVPAVGTLVADSVAPSG
jgi:hypothetical protein